MTLYLDIETTGLAATDRLVEIGIVNDAGAVLMQTFVNPQCEIHPGAAAVHGITADMVAGAPTLDQLLPALRDLLAAQPHVVIYNAAFDRRFFPAALWRAVRVDCAMQAVQARIGMRVRLQTAAERAGHVWTGDAHRAVADALACRSVWHWLARGSAVGRTAAPRPLAPRADEARRRSFPS
jgi:DNA polymerase-3 subunit epsilon